MTVLITGAAGFIGFHLSKKLLLNGIDVIGIDNINNYYDPKLKIARLNELYKISEKLSLKFENLKINIEDSKSLEEALNKIKPKKIIHLAAQAGVRYSIENPNSYIQSNLVGFANILECCRNLEVENLIFASSSSVYGMNSNIPFSESDNVDHPISLYAASKKSNELMAHAYSHLYKIPVTGLRFFTVYGPWGRPDMALFLFTKSIIQGKPINVYNHGNMIRDFTFVDDIVESVFKLLNKPAYSESKFNTKFPNPSISSAPYRIFNIGNSNPTQLNDYIDAIENSLGIKATRNYLDMQQGDVAVTSSDCGALENWIGFKPYTPVELGIEKFINWYKDFYNIC